MRAIRRQQDTEYAENLRIDQEKVRIFFLQCLINSDIIMYIRIEKKHVKRKNVSDPLGLKWFVCFNSYLHQKNFFCCTKGYVGT